MLRSRVLVLAGLATLWSGAARAEAVTPASAAVQVTGDIAGTIAGEGRPHIAAAAMPADATTTPAPVSDGVTEPAKTGEPVTAAEPAKPVAAAAPLPPPPPTLTAKIDLAAQTMVVSENGDAKYSWPISSGTAEFPTPRGTFRPQWTAKMWYSRKYDNAPMPNAVFINGGVAVHATQHVSRLGSAASHGCIRLAPGNAKTFYNLVQHHGLKMTRVSIYGTPKWRAPAMASRSAPRPRYAEQQNDSFWFSSSKTYQPTSAYDQGFTKRQDRQQYRQVYRQAPRQYQYYANAQPQRVYYRRPNTNPRVVYAQRPRRVYYYSNSGYGYGGGGW